MGWFNRMMSKKISRLEFQIDNRNNMIDDLIKEKCDLERKLSERINEKTESVKLAQDDADKALILAYFPIGKEFQYLMVTMRVVMHDKTQDLTRHYGPNAKPVEYYGIKASYRASDGKIMSKHIGVADLHAIVADVNNEIGAKTEDSQ